jgi:hypothetical protein
LSPYNIISTIYGIPNGFCSEKSIIESASVSMSMLSENPSSTGSRLIILSSCEAPDVDPTISSPTVNAPLTLETLYEVSS